MEILRDRLKKSLNLFRSLFTANERMKTEYCNLQTDYKTLKTENNQLKLKVKNLFFMYYNLEEEILRIFAVYDREKEKKKLWGNEDIILFRAFFQEL